MMSDLEDVIDLAHVDRVTADQLYPFLAWALAVIPGASTTPHRPGRPYPR